MTQKWTRERHETSRLLETRCIQKKTPGSSAFLQYNVFLQRGLIYQSF
jgi:hypothetical protein